MTLLDQVGRMTFADYNPAYVIEAVNALQPLGKEAALVHIETYLATRSEGEYPYSLFWVLRVLFEVAKEQGFPPVHMGQPSIPPPADPGLLPRFPIVLVLDIPLLASGGYLLRGLPEPVTDHVAYFRQHGTVRQRPLAPPQSVDGVEAEFLKRWTAAYGDASTTEVLLCVRPQIARMGE